MHRLYSMVLPIARHLGGEAESEVKDIHSNLLSCNDLYFPSLRRDLRLFQEAEAMAAKIMAEVDARTKTWLMVSDEIGYLTHLKKLAPHDAMFCVYHIQYVCRSARSRANKIAEFKDAYIAALREARIEKVEAVETLVERAVPHYRGLRDAIAHEGERITKFEENAAPVDFAGINTGDVSIGLGNVQSGRSMAFTHKNKTLVFEMEDDLPKRMESVVKSVMDFMQPYSDAHNLDTGWHGPLDGK